MAEITGVPDRSEIVQIAAERLNMDSKKVDEVFDAIIQVKTELLIRHGYIQIHEEGTYHLRDMPADSGTTPGGTPWAYAAGERVKIDFNPAQRIKDAVSAGMSKILIS